MARNWLPDNGFHSQPMGCIGSGNPNPSGEFMENHAALDHVFTASVATAGRRRRLSTIFTAMALLAVTAFFAAFCFCPELMSTKVAGHMSLGIVLEPGLILLAIMLAFVYVRCADGYDGKSISVDTERQS
jgi:uncharacterized membrane protein (DUF485 family)